MAELVPAKQKLVNMRGLLAKQQGEIMKALPRGLDAQRFVRAALTVFARKPELLDCTTQSVIGALMQCAQYGLELDPGLGQAYLVPYGRECVMITGYQGLVTLAMRTPDVKSVIARAVYAKDVFDYELGLNEKLFHKPTAEPDKGELTYVYAIAKLVDRDGMVPIFEVMSKKEVDAIRARSRAGKSGPWVTDYEMMARKTGVRRLSKWLPKSTDFARAVAAEDRFEMGKPGDGVDEMIEELLAEPPVEGVVVGQQPGQPEPAKPETTSLDKLADKIEQQPAAETVPKQDTKPATAPAAQEPSGTTQPAKAAKPRPEHDPRPDAPPSPTARDLSRQEQASRHEVPRAHQQPAAKPAEPAKPAAPVQTAGGDTLTADEIDWGQSTSTNKGPREPGEEG